MHALDVFNLLSLIGGLTFFLYGMNVMSSSLEKMAGGRLEEMLRRMTANPLLSMVLGAVITIAMQSSSATTVMLVGLVNSGIMQFSQTIHIIFGANVGTTLTAWITSLSGIQSDLFWVQMLKPKNFSPLLAFAGILMLMLSKKDRKKTVGTVLVGFAVLMYGMEMMSGAVSPRICRSLKACWCSFPIPCWACSSARCLPASFKAPPPPWASCRPCP